MENSHGIPVTFINNLKFSIEGNYTDVFVENRKVKAYCGDDGFKYGEVTSTEWISASGGITMVNLRDFNSDYLTSNLSVVWYETQPCTDDGRPIVRPDSRPLNTSTYFTMSGDDIDNDIIGAGQELRWDFSNSDNNYTGSEVPSGYKAKEFKLQFICPVYPKDGCVYFFDAPWGAYVRLDIIVPAGNYYPNPAGAIPASALGLSGDKTYSYTSVDLIYQKYVTKHFIYTDCPMGDELNAEGTAENAIPIGWYMRGLVITPSGDNISKGYAEFEMHRCHTVLLPGQSNPHS